ncbi:MAG: PDZ domain-containing protein [Clostridiaceae bacterium]
MSIVVLTLRGIAYELADPYVLMLILVMGFILYKRNKRTVMMKRMIIGKDENTAFELTISQVVIGVIAGSIISVILSVLGVAFINNVSIYLIFVLSMIFMLIKPRFVCFAYSGAALGLISIIISLIKPYYPKVYSNLDFLSIDIVALMTLIAVIHFAEGILVILDGHRGAVPVFSKQDNEIVGGYSYSRFWPIPVTIFIILQNSKDMVLGDTVLMPKWWPLINLSVTAEVLLAAIIMLVPLYGVIGYKSISFTMDRKKKPITSGLLLMVYASILFLLAQIAYINIWFKLLVVIFAPFGHESLSLYSKYREIKDKPRYVSTDEGFSVLHVLKNSPAYEMGIKSGDLLIEVNNNKIEIERDILDAESSGINFIWFKIKTIKGEIKEVSYNKMNSTKRLGIVFVPKLASINNRSKIVKVDGSEESFKDILNKFKND